MCGDRFPRLDTDLNICRMGCDLGREVRCVYIGWAIKAAPGLAALKKLIGGVVVIL